MLIKEILHRLELKEAVSVEELIYLHSKAKEDPQVNLWLSKLLKALEENEMNAEYSYESTAA